MLGRRRHAAVVQERLAQRIERTGADIAEHHAERAHDQSGGGPGVSRGAGIGGGRWSKGGRGHDIERRQGWRRRDGLHPRLPPVNAPNRGQLRRKRLTWRRSGGGLGAWPSLPPSTPPSTPTSAIRGFIATIPGGRIL